MNQIKTFHLGSVHHWAASAWAVAVPHENCNTPVSCIHFSVGQFTFSMMQQGPGTCMMHHSCSDREATIVYDGTCSLVIDPSPQREIWVGGTASFQVETFWFNKPKCFSLGQSTQTKYFISFQYFQWKFKNNSAKWTISHEKFKFCRNCIFNQKTCWQKVPNQLYELTTHIRSRGQN